MQEAWIQHATVKENILFGQPFDSEKYNAVVFACALEKVRDRGPKIPRMVVVGRGGGAVFLSEMYVCCILTTDDDITKLSVTLQWLLHEAVTNLIKLRY